VEQPHAQTLLQPGHGLADRRGRDAQIAAGGGETPTLGRMDESVERAEAVHAVPDIVAGGV